MTPPNCVMCGQPIPHNQGSRTCSMCYGDIDHGKDGYYRDYMEQWDRESERQQQERDREQEEPR